jgi:homopolymeric O-antigen transport system permease protein
MTAIPVGTATESTARPEALVGAVPVSVIEPTRGFTRINIRELWHYRDLLYFLTWREISIRYKQTVLGLLWAILQPLATMLVFTVFLGRLAKVPSDGVPYPVFAYLGLLPWTYFANAVTRSGSSLVANQNLLSKVYFPRLLIPLSAALSALIDFVIAFGILIVLMLVYGITPALSSVLLVPLSVLMALAALGVGMYLSALNVRYRDVQHALPFAIQLWMFATPVVYPASLVPAKWKLVFALNPLSGIIEGYRSAALGRPLDWHALGVSLSVTLLLFVLGFWQFRRLEREFADIV